MAWIRQLSSGLWAATVRFGPGANDRITETDPLKTVITNWARDLETDVRRKDFIDPRRAEILLCDYREQVKGRRHKERASQKRDESQWRNHVEPRWGDVQLGQIMKHGISAWVVDMEQSHRDDCRNPKRCPGCRVGAATVIGAVGVLRGLLDLAVEEGILRENAARNIKKRPPDAHVDRILDNDEEDQLRLRGTELFGDRVDGILFVDLLLDTGIRWEEAAAIPPELLDTKRQRIHIAWVMERDGTARPYAKTEAGNRTVAYGDELASRLEAAKLAAPVCPGVFPVRRGLTPKRLVFHAPEGGALFYTNWRRRVWVPMLLGPPTPGVKREGSRGPAPLVPGASYLDDPQPTPHDCRHTFGTRLGDNGIPIHDLMELMGHDDVRSAKRYLHSSDERFKRAREALKRARGDRVPEGSGESGVDDAGGS